MAGSREGSCGMGAGRVRYANGDLLAEIRPRVLATLAEHGLSPRRVARAWLDVALAAGWFFAMYAVLLFVALPPWGYVLAIASMGLATTATLMHIVHPLMHRSVGRSTRLNVLAAQVLAPLPGSWRWWAAKHNLGHHAFPSVAGNDPDFDQAPVLRCDSSAPWRPWHRWQHVYAWLLYALLSLRWSLAADVPFILTGRENGRSMEQPSVRRTALLLLDKFAPVAVFLTPAFLLHPAVNVVAFSVAVLVVNGFSTALIFVPGHFGDARPLVAPDADGKIPTDYATTIVQGVVNMRVRNPIGRWFVGGLDHHIEHHLFAWVSPRDLHLIAPIVESAVRAHGLSYRTHESLGQGLREHARRLRTFGRRPTHLPTVETTVPVAA